MSTTLPTPTDTDEGVCPAWCQDHPIPAVAGTTEHTARVAAVGAASLDVIQVDDGRPVILQPEVETLTPADLRPLAAALITTADMLEGKTAWRAACTACGWSHPAPTYEAAGEAARTHGDTCADASTEVAPLGGAS